MKVYPEDLGRIIVVHGENMESAGKCKARHDAIMEIIERYEEKYRDQ